MSSNAKELVLVTGGTGFVGVHCIVKLLNANYRVKTTIRSLKRKQDVLNMLKEADIQNTEDVSFVEADLGKDAGWTEAAKDCMYVLHVASPFPTTPPKHEDDLISPAREGTLRVLRASRDAGVKRVVITSSMAAIQYGHRNVDYSTKVFTEEDWSDPTYPGLGAYLKSKTIAERAAWDFVEKDGGALELSVVNPGLILGPVLSADNSASIEIITRLMNGALPGAPHLHFTIVDVRDLADLHLLAMTRPEAKGERFIAVSPPPMSMKEVSTVLRARLGHAARRCPTREIPDFVLKAVALFDSTVSLVTPELSKIKQASIEKAKTKLEWDPRPAAEAAVASAESMVRLKLVKP